MSIVQKVFAERDDEYEQLIAMLSSMEKRAEKFCYWSPSSFSSDKKIRGAEGRGEGDEKAQVPILHRMLL